MPNTPPSQPAFPLAQSHKFDRKAIDGAAEELRSQGVEYVYAAYTDVHGALKAKCSPISSFGRMARGGDLFTVGAMDGMGLSGPHQDECASIPDLSTLRTFPWDRTRALFFGQLWHHGSPYANDGRNVLIRQLARAEALGFRFNLGLEPEFYVFSQGSLDHPEPFTTSRYRKSCAAFDLVLTEESMCFLDPMARYLDELGCGITSISQEGGRGQYEISAGYADALTTADRFVFLRFMARQVAASMGLVASFMAKPFDDDLRSGAHFNMSLSNTETGENLFAPAIGNDAGKLRGKHGLPLSDLGYQFLAGQLAHAEAIAAVTCPTFNSYQGLITKGDEANVAWALMMVAYGWNNRSAMMRVPPNRYAVENRAPDMSCNPYLAAAISLAAGLDGIERGLDPGEPVNQRCHQLTRSQRMEKGIRMMPKTLFQAAEYFRNSELAAATFGDLHEIYADLKVSEFDEAFYRIHPKDREERLTFL